ncbi:hypothetical protein ACWGI8_03555 [Streptomyces sp. NPDC054841]
MSEEAAPRDVRRAGLRAGPGGHVQLCIGNGNGKVVHAPRPGSTVTIAPLPPSSQVVAYRHISA